MHKHKHAHTWAPAAKNYHGWEKNGAIASKQIKTEPCVHQPHTQTTHIMLLYECVCDKRKNINRWEAAEVWQILPWAISLLSLSLSFRQPCLFPCLLVCHVLHPFLYFPLSSSTAPIFLPFPFLSSIFSQHHLSGQPPSSNQFFIRTEHSNCFTVCPVSHPTRKLEYDLWKIKKRMNCCIVRTQAFIHLVGMINGMALIQFASRPQTLQTFVETLPRTLFICK